MSDFKANYRGIGEMLCMPEMVAEMGRRAEKVAEAARAAAPFDPNSKDGTHYKDAFTVTADVRQHLATRRAVGTVRNDDGAAVFVEFGTSHSDPHHTLARALDAARD